MPSQSDFQAGFDLTSLPSATQAQVMQAINQIAPLINIGGIVFQAGTSLAATIAQGTGGSPSVTDNPRFARYLWLNTFSGTFPTPYFYNSASGNWTATTVAALSITNAEIATAAAIAVTKLAIGTARHLIRTNAAGTANEFVNPNSIFTNDDVPLNAIDDTGASGSESFLRRVSGVTIWKTFAETVTAIQNALSGVNPSVLTPGSNNTLLGTNSAGTVAFDVPNNLFANLALNITKLAQSGATTSQVIRWDGSSWTPASLNLQLLSANSISTVGVLSASTLDASAHIITNPFNPSRPKAVRVVAVLESSDVTSAASSSYSVGDEVDIFSFESSGNNRAFGVVVGTANVYINYRASGGAIQLLVNDRSGAAAVGAIDETKWRPKVYAWL